MDKIQLRKEMLSILKAYDRKEEESKKLCMMIKNSSLWKNANTILAFIPLSTEPDISPLLNDERILLPYIENDEMRFSASRNFKRSERGFLEPEHTEENYEKALMLVPLLAFNGLYRLGRGGGYYDRYISENRSRIVTAGVAFSISERYDFILEDHDEKLDYIFSATR